MKNQIVRISHLKMLVASAFVILVKE